MRIAPVDTSPSSSRVCDKILVVITEDWFALSHFRPLLQELCKLASEVVVATSSSGRLDEISRLGVRTIAFDMCRGSIDPRKQAAVRARLARLIECEQPDAVHAISLQPMLISSLAARSARSSPRALILHVTGLGYVATARTLRARLLRHIAFSLIRLSTAGKKVWLLAENPDDIDFVLSRGIGKADATTIVPGAGVDPVEFPAQPPPLRQEARVAFVGRIIRSKGVEVLAAAHMLLHERGVPIETALYGAPDPHNPDAVPLATLEDWSRQPGLSWHGRTGDIPGVWREADIAAFPTRGGEGVPRALLEAAASARPIVASDVSGCRHFIRHGVEGLLVAPGDVEGFTAALQRLATDRSARERMGAAARTRFLDGYTTASVTGAIRDAYVRVFS